MSNFVASLNNFEPSYSSNNAYETLFEQYEKVIMQSLFTSFGLDFIVQDQHGGDVDTIHNVRAMEHDKDLTYKDKAHQEAYDNRGAYDSKEYHSHEGYIAKNREVSRQKKEGSLYDAYTGEHIAANARTDLDHIVSAKEIHDDRARVLSGLNGADLANNPDNLAATNPHTNRSKKAQTMDEYLDKKGYEYTSEQQERMRSLDKKSRQSMDRKISYEYYTSPDFFRSSAMAATKVGFTMGLRQVLGLVCSEIWFSIRAEFKYASGSNESMLHKVITGFKNGLANAKERYKELWQKFIEGSISGALSSITTTICNMFFTTAKNIVRVIRQIWSSLVEAAKVLFFNPDRLPIGERFRAVAKILATGASVVVGTAVSEAVKATSIGAIPIIGQVLCDFLGALVTGIMACTLLYVLDKCEFINKLIYLLNQLSPYSDVAAYYRHLSALMDEYCAKVMDIDLALFKQQTERFNQALIVFDNNVNVSDQVLLNSQLKAIYQQLSLEMPYDTSNGKTLKDNLKNPNFVLKFRKNS